MKAVLHIGTEKTGTSSIQEFLFQNKAGLEQQGYYYLHMKGTNEYRDLPAYCMRKGKYDRYFRLKGVIDNSSRSDFDVNFLMDFRVALSAVPENAHTVIISSEHLSSRLNSNDEVMRVKELLANTFSSFVIICYLRDQSHKLASSYSTKIKSGGSESFTDYFINYLNRGRDYYDDSLDAWEKIFGLSNIKIRVFDKSLFVGGSLISDFCYLLASGLVEKLHVPLKHENQSLSRVGCEIMRHINFLFFYFSKRYRWLENIRLGIVVFISVLFKGKSITLTDGQRLIVKNKYETSNDRVCRKYFNDREDLFGI